MARLIGSAANLCPQVDVHEGCTRLRLNNLLILFNVNKLSGVVEIGAELTTTTNVTTEQSTSLTTLSGPTTAINIPFNFIPNVQKCRFCTNPLKSDTEVMFFFNGAKSSYKIIFLNIFSTTFF